MPNKTEVPKKPLKRIEILIRNAHKLGVKPVSGKYLWDNQEKLMDMYDKDSFNKLYNEILKKHGYTKLEWLDIMFQSNSFYFLPTEKIENCNRDVRRLCKKFGVVNPIYSYNYLYALLSHYNRRKKPNIRRFKINGVFHYELIDF